LTVLDPFVGRLTGREVAEKLSKTDYDVFITNDFAMAAYTKTGNPIVLYTDVMITHDYSERNLPHSRLANLSWISLMLSRVTIKRGLQRAALCFFPAQWAVDEAARYYNDPSKFVVLPFGANIEDPGAQVAMERSFLKIIRKGTIDLLFVGKDWARKGGDIAVRTTIELRKRGISAFLHIVGGTPPSPVDPSCITVYGLLDKTIAADREKLSSLYRESDVFILPSSSEGFVIVVLEAAAYGLPVLAYDTIGVTGAVQDGETGVLLRLGHSEKAFADVIENWFKDPSSYDRLVLGARKHYEKTANWETCISTLFEKIRQHLNL
jgi:glycosyltransferase involved in cell wall biosynthesis